ncbi:MAG: type II toxin-antitoxin system PemK/MazF family toxin [Euryarchaeota archaeon]|nr:type II toxin-antitoxin system PemK/MazF family toxin [Euryarchaeota archaeon]MBU4339660.1 type II toxin-antitoxin system PemK/MazF family toxin [Euryarchaeota archaeon]MCG2737265.1 type II toxin-antitoxin system PemK/MazF family toxin [Candidatus Methanoperedenaceae archaeon]
MIYDRGDVVILPFPFITPDGVQQKARPALIVSDHSIERRFDDVILAGITSQRTDDIKQTEFIIKEGTDEFIRSGLAKTSVVRCEYLMTVPEGIIARKLGKLSDKEMHRIDKVLKMSLGFR